MLVKICCFIVISTYLNCVNGAITNEENHNTVARGFDAKGMLSSLAGSLMSRGYAGLTGIDSGSSQVVSLNLTNLVVLILLKALIFAAGSLGAGSWKGGYARSNDGEEKLITDEEILLFLSYLTARPGETGCLKNIACQQPGQARKYAAAGDILLKTTKTLSMQPDQNYEYMLQELQEAANWGMAGGRCDTFLCGAEKNKGDV